MKKIVILMSIFIIIFSTVFLIESNAQEIVTINTSINKTIVNPGDTINLSIGFDKPLGEYTLDILYDDNLLEYETYTEGTLADLANGIRMTYSSATTPSNGLIITFRAKLGITTSNKTNFAVTGTGLASIAAEAYEDVTTPVNEEFTVEPEYTDYTFSLSYDGAIQPNEEKEIKIGITSPMGRYHDKVRLVAELIKPVGSTVTMIGIDNANVKHDLITHGWGDTTGYSIGGKDFAQEFKFASLFDTLGDYKLTLRLVDLDGNHTIAQKAFDIKLGHIPPPVGGSEHLPGQLPKTGYDSIIVVSLCSIIGVSIFAYYLERKTR